MLSCLLRVHHATVVAERIGKIGGRRRENLLRGYCPFKSVVVEVVRQRGGEETAEMCAPSFTLFLGLSSAAEL